jgi:putative phosphoribosyl transferase
MDQLVSTLGVGDLHVPRLPQGVIVVAMDSGAQCEALAESFLDARFATLRLAGTPPPGGLSSHASIKALRDQVLAATDWVGARTELAGLPIGVFGCKGGGSAALAAATERPEAFRAVVSHDGRPMLAGSALQGVRAATLLIVAGEDAASVAFSQDAMARVQGIAEIEVLPAGEVLDEAGTRAHVARLARRWFERFLA